MRGGQPTTAIGQLPSVLDGTKLRELANLPEPIDLHEGLRRTVEWLKSKKA